jgi:hypothetical protein
MFNIKLDSIAVLNIQFKTYCILFAFILFYDGLILNYIGGIHV